MPNRWWSVRAGDGLHSTVGLGTPMRPEHVGGPSALDVEHVEDEGLYEEDHVEDEEGYAEIKRELPLPELDGLYREENHKEEGDDAQLVPRGGEHEQAARHHRPTGGSAPRGWGS